MATVDLYFHAPCFDGLASAVVCWDFLEWRGDTRGVTLRPVGYDLKAQWLSTALPPHAAVVDFLFHPAAAFWADHHETTFLNEVARGEFEASSSPNWAYDSRASSCAAFLRKHLRRAFGYRNTRYDTLVDWADRIDSASYRDVRQAVMAPTAALQISMAIGGADGDLCVRLVRMLKRHSVSSVAKSNVVQRRVRAARASMREGLRKFEKTARLEKDNIVVFDVDTHGAPVSRYAPYYFYPKARYSIGVLRSPEGTKITAMRNPWRKFQSVPIGSIFARHGGGGHQRVGSVIIKENADEDPQQVLTELLTEIRERDREQTRDGN